MERIIVSEITAHLYKNNLITSDQHGFLKQLSTCTNLLESVNDWTVLLEGGSKVAVAYVDFARAFDSVTHTKLLRKLQMYGISGDLLDFISFYLSNRNHCTRVGNSLSSFAKIRSGVIQGSCIGPLLFVLFINDITNSLCPGSKAKLFADDLKLYATIETALGVAYFQKCLDIIFKWSKDWQLEISYLKCFIILLDRRLNATFCRPIFKLGDHVLEYKSTGSDLGVNIDEKLSFTDHISKIAMKAHQRSSLILRSFTSRDTNSLVRAFKVYVRPILEYNSQVWSPIAMKDIMAIEKVQKRFTKKIPGCKNLTYHQRLNKLNLESLELRRIRADLKFTFKLIFNKTALKNKDFIIINNSNERQLRSHNYQIRPIHKLNTVRSNQNFFNRIVTIWNELPSTTNFNSINSFTNSISKDFLARHCKLNFN